MKYIYEPKTQALLDAYVRRYNAIHNQLREEFEDKLYTKTKGLVEAIEKLKSENTPIGEELNEYEELELQQMNEEMGNGK